MKLNDELAVIAGEVVLGDQQDLERVGDVLGQRDLRRVPVPAAEEREVLTLVERHVVVRVPEILGVDVATQFLLDDRLELEYQRIRYRFLCHKVTVTRVHMFSEIGSPKQIEWAGKCE